MASKILVRDVVEAAHARLRHLGGKITPPEYRGMFVEQDHIPEKERRRDYQHKIFLFNPIDEKAIDEATTADEYFRSFHQVVHCELHNMADFEFNCKKIIKYLKRWYGDTSVGIWTIAQPIQFTVYDGQKEPFVLSLFRFFMNYTMIIPLVELGADMDGWTPWVPEMWSPDAWVRQMNKYIKDCRVLANTRKIGECLELSKYMLNLFCARCGDRFGLSIGNWDFIQVMKRSQEAFETITCSFDIPDNITPTELEGLTMDRTQRLLGIINKQRDLALSVYTRNNLFNVTQFREFAVHICHKPDLSGNTIPYTYPTNIMMGIDDPRAFSVDAHGGRKAEITKLNVSDAGTLERALVMLMSPMQYVDMDYECDSRHFRKRYISSMQNLQKLEGRVFTKDPKSTKFWILEPDTMSDLIGTTIYLKTPITCTHPLRHKGFICSACYGKLMASINDDVHIGRLAAVQSADEIEQKLLSAKHALKTDTVEISFGEAFYRFFELGHGSISMNQEMVSESTNDNPDSDFKHLYLEFYPNTMGKHQDGESRRFDRSFSEIVIYDDRDESRITIEEENGATLYLSPEFNDDHFLDALHYNDGKEPIRIPFKDIIDNGKVITQVLFEFSYRNNELASPLLTLEKIMFNCETINSFSTYDECLDTIIPLFVKGGIHIPDYQSEMLVSQMVYGPDGKPVDWNDPNPKYEFMSISRSINLNPSPLTSILYREAGAHIAGSHGTYEKSAPDSYSWFVLEKGRNKHRNTTTNDNDEED